MSEQTIKTPQEIEKMRIAGRLTAKVLEAVGEIIKPGITTAEIDEFCERYITNTLHAIPGSKGQYGYPYSVNTSVNKVVCHGMPSKNQILEKGDIVNVDVTVIKDGYYGDSSKMFCVGPVATHAQRLVDVTQECLYRGIKAVKPGATLRDIGYAIENWARKHNYSVVEEYCGHGIGKHMHEKPQILHYVPNKFGKHSDDVEFQLQAGMTFTIEPMINQGKSTLKHKEEAIDQTLYSHPLLKNVKPLETWPIAITKDNKLSAQWEHTILVTPTGFEILTLRDEEKNHWQ